MAQPQLVGAWLSHEHRAQPQLVGAWLSHEHRVQPQLVGAWLGHEHVVIRDEGASVAEEPSDIAIDAGTLDEGVRVAEQTDVPTELSEMGDPGASVGSLLPRLGGSAEGLLGGNVNGSGGGLGGTVRGLSGPSGRGPSADPGKC